MIQRINTDVIYIRHKITEFTFLRFLKKIKKFDKRIISIIEFPTFPYDDNWKRESLQKKTALPVDRIFRKKLHPFVDLVVCNNNYDSIYDIKAIGIFNAVDLRDIQVQEDKEFNNSLVLIGVAGLGYWHGFDRIIEGLYQYYNNKNNSIKVYFDIVGEGPVENELKQLTKKYNLDDYITFHGTKVGMELDELYKRSHVGIGALACHRIGINDTASLKLREYCARGLPFLLEVHDYDFPETFKYSMRVPYDDEPVAINEVVDFFININKNYDYMKEMRKYAATHLSWKAKLKRVIDIIDNMTD